MNADTQARNRLHNMEVEEISLVDRPANKRKFLIVKHADGGQENLELVPQKDGVLRLVESETETDATSDESRETIKLSKEMKTSILEVAASILEKLTEFTKNVDEAEETDESQVPDTLISSLEEIGKSMAELQEKAKKKKPEEAECKGDSEVETEEAPAVQNDDLDLNEVKAELHKLDIEIQKMHPRGIEPSTREDINAGAGEIPDDPGVPLMSAEEFLGRVDGLSQIMKLNDELNEKNSELEARIEQLEKAAADSSVSRTKVGKNVGLPNSGPVDSRTIAGFSGWPLDLNSEAE